MIIQYAWEFELPETGYRVLEDIWEDGDEWQIIEITDAKLQTIVALQYTDMIVDNASQ